MIINIKADNLSQKWFLFIFVWTRTYSLDTQYPVRTDFINLEANV